MTMLAYQLLLLKRTDLSQNTPGAQYPGCHSIFNVPGPSETAASTKTTTTAQATAGAAASAAPSVIRLCS